MRATLLSQQHLADTEINETEEYLGILRAKKAAIELRVGEAEEQIGVMREVLDEHGIRDTPLSGEGGTPSSDGYPLPPSSSPASKSHIDQATSDGLVFEEPTAFTDENIASERQRIMDELMGSTLDDSGHVSDQ